MRRAVKILLFAIVTIAVTRVGHMVFDPVWKDSRTQTGPLPVEHSRYYTSPSEYVSLLPGLHQLGGDGFRFVANPFRGTRDYALAVWRPKGSRNAKGVLIVFDRETGKGQPHDFNVSAIEFDRAMQQFDRTIAWWIGEGTMCLDGTSTAFERVRGRRIVSGQGNAACSDHYGALSAVAVELAKPAKMLTNPPQDFRWQP